MALARCNLVITDGSGNIVNGASVTVRRESDLGLASLFSDRAGTAPNALGNPFIAADGSDAGFHVVGGAYKITATSGLFSKTWRYEGVGTGSEMDSSVVATGTTLGREIADRFADTINVADFSGTFTAALTAALLTGAKNVIIPAGNHSLTAGVTISTSGQRLIGQGRTASVITSTASGHSIAIATGLTGVELHDFTLTRSGSPATSGQNGIHFSQLTERALVSRVDVSLHFVGIRLGTTSFSKVIECVCDNNYSHGINITNATASGGMQWTLIDCLSQRNDGYGLLYEAVTASSSVGEIINFSTFANKLGGARFLGQASGPIRLQGIRWHDGFIGEDGGHGIYLDTYGTSTHKIQGVFCELAGVSACGVNQTTSAPNVGNGIHVTANNVSVVVDDCVALFNSYSGIKSAADRIAVRVCESRLNGAASVAGERNGIHITAGNATIVGNSSKANLNGLTLGNDNHIVIANDFTENTTGIVSVALSTSMVMYNLGSTIQCAGAAVGQYPGTATNDNAAAGKVGEYIESIVPSGSAVSLTTNTPVNITSISLTAGDWDVELIAQFTGNTATTVSSQEASISLTTATLDYTGGKGVAVTGNAAPYNQIAGTSAIGLVVPPVRFSLNATTTIFAVARSIFGTNVSSVYGKLRARRVR